jgi:hypothetical protein
MDPRTNPEFIAIYDLLRPIEEDLDRRNIEIKEIYDIVERARPHIIRNAYENGMQEFLRVIESHEITMRGVDTLIELLNRIKDKINTYKDEHQEIIKLFNRGKISTLEGLAREKVAEPQVKVSTNNDVLTQSVLGQPYDELAAVRKGGKKKRKTRKSGRKAGYRKTRSSTFSTFKKGYNEVRAKRVTTKIHL